MSLNMRYSDDDKLGVFLKDIVSTSERAGEKAQEESAKVIKVRVVGQLNRLRTQTMNPTYKHMADDVSITTAKDSHGDKIKKIQGGKRTGTKWHLVNDGMYTSSATHFMDKALKEVESEVESIIDANLSKLGD